MIGFFHQWPMIIAGRRAAIYLRVRGLRIFRSVDFSVIVPAFITLQSLRYCIQFRHFLIKRIDGATVEEVPKGVGLLVRIREGGARFFRIPVFSNVESVPDVGYLIQS